MFRSLFFGVLLHLFLINLDLIFHVTLVSGYHDDNVLSPKLPEFLYPFLHLNLANDLTFKKDSL